MKKYIFITHSSHDVAKAQEIRDYLEANGIQCWMAPRDIPIGEEWAKGILHGINTASGMLLVFSSNSNDSSQVRREIERAIHNNISIYPVRIEDVQPSDAMEYYISSNHWMDAFGGNFETNLDKLVTAIKSKHNFTESEDLDPISKPVQPKKQSSTPTSQVTNKSSKSKLAFPKLSFKMNKKILFSIAFLLLLVIGFSVLKPFENSSQVQDLVETQVAETPDSIVSFIKYIGEPNSNSYASDLAITTAETFVIAGCSFIDSSASEIQYWLGHYDQNGNELWKVETPIQPNIGNSTSRIAITDNNIIIWSYPIKATLPQMYIELLIGGHTGLAFDFYNVDGLIQNSDTLFPKQNFFMEGLYVEDNIANASIKNIIQLNDTLVAIGTNWVIADNITQDEIGLPKAMFSTIHYYDISTNELLATEAINNLLVSNLANTNSGVGYIVRSNAVLVYYGSGTYKGIPGYAARLSNDIGEMQDIIISSSFPLVLSRHSEPIYLFSQNDSTMTFIGIPVESQLNHFRSNATNFVCLSFLPNKRIEYSYRSSSIGSSQLVNLNGAINIRNDRIITFGSVFEQESISYKGFLYITSLKIHDVLEILYDFGENEAVTSMVELSDGRLGMLIHSSNSILGGKSIILAVTDLEYRLPITENKLIYSENWDSLDNWFPGDELLSYRGYNFTNDTRTAVSSTASSFTMLGEYGAGDNVSIDVIQTDSPLKFQFMLGVDSFGGGNDYLYCGVIPASVEAEEYYRVILNSLLLMVTVLLQLQLLGGVMVLIQFLIVLEIFQLVMEMRKVFIGNQHFQTHFVMNLVH